MKTSYEYWENQDSLFNSKFIIPSTINDFILSSKYLFNNKNTVVTSKFISNSPKKDSHLTSCSDFSISHLINDLSKISFSQAGPTSTLKGDVSLFKKLPHYVSLSFRTLLKNNERDTTLPITAGIKYHFNDNAMISCGLENYDCYREKDSQNVHFSVLKGHNFKNGANIYGGVYVLYSLAKKIINFNRFALAYKYGNVVSGINVLLNRRNGEEKGIFGKLDQYEKKLISKNFLVYNNITFGSLFELDLNTFKSVKNVNFVNYNIDPNTTLKTRWENDSKTIITSISHNFRRIFKLTVSGKFDYGEPAKDKDNNDYLKFCFPKTKVGFSCEIFDSSV